MWAMEDVGFLARQAPIVDGRSKGKRHMLEWKASALTTDIA
jgi:hypothetical protein